MAPRRRAPASRRPGTQNPHLAITKVATEAGYASVGDVIHYTVVATNDGNVTLASVTVTDPNASGLVCTPANGSRPGPGCVIELHRHSHDHPG